MKRTIRYEPTEGMWFWDEFTLYPLVLNRWVGTTTHKLFSNRMTPPDKQVIDKPRWAYMNNPGDIKNG